MYIIMYIVNLIYRDFENKHILILMYVSECLYETLLR